MKLNKTGSESPQATPETEALTKKHPLEQGSVPIEPPRSNKQQARKKTPFFAGFVIIIFRALSVFNRRNPKVLPRLLFLLTAASTLYSGVVLEGGDIFRNPAELLLGIPFAGTLLSILFVHEMGHYLTAKHYGVDASAPYFMPGPWWPFGIGTFGAMIHIRSPIYKKNQLLHIGAAGPIAGFVVALIAVAVGLNSSTLVTESNFVGVLKLGDPLIFSWIAEWMGKLPGEGQDIALSPIAFAGWFGLFVTAMNLFPMGQLDGGHILYAMVGEKHRHISKAAIVIFIMLGIQGWWGWFLWAGVAALTGVNHPPVIDGRVPLLLRHKFVVLVSLIIFIVTFTPNPFTVVGY